MIYRSSVEPLTDLFMNVGTIVLQWYLFSLLRACGPTEWLHLRSGETTQLDSAMLPPSPPIFAERDRVVRGQDRREKLGKRAGVRGIF
jgi:hypothetical protein